MHRIASPSPGAAISLRPPMLSQSSSTTASAPARRATSA
jgi:hypothetical protein